MKATIILNQEHNGIEIAFDSRPSYETRGKLLAAAQDGLTVYDRGGDAYRLAANWRGWCTLVNPLGVIIHSWAGNFSILPPTLQGVRT